MRKKLLFATLFASIAAVGLGTSAGATGDDNFIITASSPGNINFKGQGTAQFNNSRGSNNSFQVGSATSLGVNASASSTPEYGVTSSALLNLGTDTTLEQTIGTSGITDSTTDTSTRAQDLTRSSMASRGWDAEWESGRTYTNRAGQETTYDSQAAYSVDYTSEYSSELSRSYTSVRASETASGNSGQISGSFKTTENSRAGAGGNSATWESEATTAVNLEYGNDYNSRGDTYTSMSETDYAAARETFYNREYANASASNNRFSDSEVTVKGIGSDANITSADSSSFTTTVATTPFDELRTDDAGSTGTAQGAAGANLSTVSLANQSQSETASGFIQAFGAQ